jgi:hypothetical protein
MSQQTPRVVKCDTFYVTVYESILAFQQYLQRRSVDVIFVISCQQITKKKAKCVGGCYTTKVMFPFYTTAMQQHEKK